MNAIGKVKIENPSVLAPMAGVTDLAFRLLAKEMGCGLVVSEMVSAKGLLYENCRTKELIRIDPRERPTAIQLFGSVPDELAEAARRVAASGADIIDFNMGCPTHKIVRNGEGSALLRFPELAERILQAMVAAVDVPVTVKIRAGWDGHSINAVEIAKRAEQAGVSAIAVHGRTREGRQYPFPGSCRRAGLLAGTLQRFTGHHLRQSDKAAGRYPANRILDAVALPALDLRTKADGEFLHLHSAFERYPEVPELVHEDGRSEKQQHSNHHVEKFQT